MRTHLLPHAVMSAAVLVAAASPALSATPSREEGERVRQLVEAARTHREAGEFQKALDVLHEAIDVKATPGLFFAVGQVHEDAGRLDLALAWYSLCFGADADAETRKRAESRTLALGDAGLRVNIVEFILKPANAELLVDGVVWKERLGRVLSLSIGDHTITVRRHGFETAAIPFEVKGPLPQRFELALLPKAPEPPPPPPPPPPRAEADGGPGVWPWVTVGAGVAAAAVGTWLVLDGTADWDRVRDAQGDLSLTRAEADALVADGDQKRTAGFVAAGIGGALVLSGVLWYVLDSGSDDGTAFTLLPGPGGMKVGFGGSF